MVRPLPRRPTWRWAGRVLAVLTVGVLGAVIGLYVAGSTRADVGPFVLTLSLRPALTGSTVVDVPPLGQLRLETHHAPVRLVAQVSELREQAARDLVEHPERLDGLGHEVDHGLRRALVPLVLRAVLVSVVGALLLGFLVFRSPGRTLIAGATGFATLLAAGTCTALTFDKRALEEPRYTGLLASAPAAVGDVRDVVQRIDAYSRSLGRLVGNLTQLYATASQLPVYTPGDNTIRLLHVSDLHLSPSAYDVIAPVVKQFRVDAVVDSGDITDWGSEPEARYVAGIGRLGVPYVYIRGNHDSAATAAAVAAQPGAVVLNGGTTVDVAGLSFLGRGDPRFTPDKTTRDDHAPPAEVQDQGKRLRAEALIHSPHPDVVVVHDPIAGERVLGAAPLVLSGHEHKRRTVRRDGSLLMVEGSTGAAGLRGLEGESPTPIEMSVLYLDAATHRLVAYDEITLGGLGDSSARIERTVVPESVSAQSPAGVARTGTPAPAALRPGG